MTAIPLAVGAVALLSTASVAFTMRRARGGPGAFPPAERLDVMSMATRKPATYHCPATRWSLDDLGAPLLQRRTWTMSRASIWRLLEEADLKPPRRVYWLHSHTPDLESKAHAICSLYLNALRVSLSRAVWSSAPMVAPVLWSAHGSETQATPRPSESAPLGQRPHARCDLPRTAVPLRVGHETGRRRPDWLGEMAEAYLDSVMPHGLVDFAQCWVTEENDRGGSWFKPTSEAFKFGAAAAPRRSNGVQTARIGVRASSA